MAARLLNYALNRWPLIVLAAFFLSSQGPHLRVTWTYRGSHEYPVYIECTYLGSRGFVAAVGPTCPLLAWIDSRDAGR